MARSRLATIFTLMPRSNSRRSRWLRTIASVSLSLVGCWLCLRFVQQLDWGCVMQDVREAGAGTALLLLTPIVGNFVHMLGWRGLLPSAARPRLGRAFAIFLVAQAANEVGSGVLGESFKVSLFRSEHRTAALRAVVLDNLTALVALFAVVLSLGCALGGKLVERFLPLPVACGVLSLTVLGGVALLARASATGHTRQALAAFAAHYVGKLSIVADFSLALGLIAQTSWRSSARLGLVTTVASVLGAPIPGQLGVVEAALGSSATWVGVAASTLLSVALLRRVRGVLWLGVGAGIYCWLSARRNSQ